MADPSDDLIDAMGAEQQAQRYLGWTSGLAREILRLTWLGCDLDEIGRRVDRTARQVQLARQVAWQRMREHAAKRGETIPGKRMRRSRKCSL